MCSSDLWGANNTARSLGSIGPKARVPKFVMGTANEVKLERTLDFGAGPKALHTWALRKQWIECHAYEFGKNFNPEEHDPYALNRKYNTVMMSNVLNVQSSRDMLIRTLEQGVKVVNKPGRLVCNYPKSPRKSDLKEKDLIEILLSYFEYVVEIEPRLYECYNQSTPMREVRRMTAYKVHIKDKVC